MLRRVSRWWEPRVMCRPWITSFSKSLAFSRFPCAESTKANLKPERKVSGCVLPRILKFQTFQNCKFFVSLTSVAFRGQPNYAKITLEKRGTKASDVSCNVSKTNRNYGDCLREQWVEGCKLDVMGKQVMTLPTLNAWECQLQLWVGVAILFAGPPGSIPFQLISIQWGGHYWLYQSFFGGWRTFFFDISILSRGRINSQPHPICVNKNSSFALPELPFVIIWPNCCLSWGHSDIFRSTSSPEKDFFDRWIFFLATEESNGTSDHPNAMLSPIGVDRCCQQTSIHVFQVAPPEQNGQIESTWAKGPTQPPVGCCWAKPK